MGRQEKSCERWMKERERGKETSFYAVIKQMHDRVIDSVSSITDADSLECMMNQSNFLGVEVGGVCVCGTGGGDWNWWIWPVNGSHLPLCTILCVWKRVGHKRYASKTAYQSSDERTNKCPLRFRGKAIYSSHMHFLGVCQVQINNDNSFFLSFVFLRKVIVKNVWWTTQSCRRKTTLFSSILP